MKNFYLLNLLFVLAIAGCRKGDPVPELTIGQTKYSLGAVEDRTATVDFNTNVEWTIFISYEGSDTDWLTAMPTSGTAGENTVELTAGENDGEAARTAYVDILYGEKTQRINVTQSGGPVKPELIIENTDYTFGAVGYRTAAVLFNTNVEWTLSVSYEGSDTDWLTATPTSGTAGENTVELTAGENDGEAIRMAYVDILYGEETQRINVTQSGMSDTTNIASLFDPEFARILKEKGYVSDAEKILPKDIAGITRLDVSGDYDNRGPLTSLRGIEYFVSLAYLNCGYNQLTTLDASENAALEELDCSFNQLTALEVSNNPALTGLSCYSNQLTELNVSNNTELKNLSCYSNQLTALDVSNNPVLTSLSCNSNQLTALDISNNTLLEILRCSSNTLTTLDVSNNTELKNLSCNSNQLTALDVSNNPVLTSLVCYSNQLTALDVSNNKALENLYCGTNQLTELNVSNNTELNKLSCYSNQLTALDVSNNLALTGLLCYSNQLTALDISDNKALKTLSCRDNPGDGISLFPVTAWFGNEAIPSGFTNGSWTYGDKTITIDYRKEE